MTEKQFDNFYLTNKDLIERFVKQGTHLSDGRLALSRRELDEWEWYDDDEEEIDSMDD
jgi:hypothetical protein